MSAPACRRCADLDGVLEALTEVIHRLTTEQPAEAPEQPAAGTERLCGHQRERVGGTVTRCVLDTGHATRHDNGRGVMWARSS